MDIHRHHLIGGLVALVVIAAATAYSAGNSFTETFDTTLYRDPTSTTVWDTAAGEIRLPPFVPVAMGSCDTPGNPRDIAVAGDWAYLSDGGSGLQIIENSGEVVPYVYNTVDTPGDAWGVAVAGDYVYVGDGGSGLQVIDVSNIAAPFIAANLNTAGVARGIEVVGNLVFLAAGTAGLQVIDITNPLAPVLLDTYDTPNEAMEVAVDGDWAYVADRSGLITVDVSDPTSLSLMGSYATSGDCWGVAASGNFAFLGDGLQGLKIVTDPYTPQLVGSYDTAGSARSVTIDGDYAIVCDYGLVQVMDITDLTSPALRFTIDNTGVATNAVVDGDRLLVAAGSTGGLQVFQFRHSAPPHMRAVTSSMPDPRGMAVRGDWAYVADYSQGLYSVDISDPTSPQVNTASATPGAHRIAFSGIYGYAASGPTGLVVYLLDPDNPQVVDTHATPGDAMGVCVDGDLAFVAAVYSGLIVFDISDPYNVTQIGSYPTPSAVLRVTVDGDYAYLGHNGAELLVVDISDPTNPTLAGQGDIPGGDLLGRDIVVAGDRLYMTAQLGEFHVFDINNPTIPVLIATADVGGLPRGLAVSGNVAYVATSIAGLVPIEISDPSDLYVMSSVNVPGGGQCAVMDGDYIFVLNGSDEVQVHQAFQNAWDVTGNDTRSLAVVQPASDIYRARIITSQTDEISWRLTATGGSWHTVQPGGDFVRFSNPGTNLQWWAVHSVNEPWVNPTCTELTIEWQQGFACIESITDVPDDQGGWVRVNVERSGLDYSDALENPIANYYMWRRVDGALPVADGGIDPAIPADLVASGLSLTVDQGRVLHESDVGAKADDLPPGTWEIVGSMPGAQQPEYIHFTPTVNDSTHLGTAWSVFCVTAHTTTPALWFASEPDSGYSIDNLAPSVPTGFQADYGTTNDLSWDICPDEDFRYFKTYRGSEPDFTVDLGNPALVTIETSWQDQAGTWGDFYKISAVDFAGNESDPVAPYEITDIPGDVAPAKYALFQNTPNPFNPMTTIKFALPVAGQVSLAVYGVDGRRVASLWDGHLTAGVHDVVWDGQDGTGREVSSGVYYCLIKAGDFHQTRAMVLVR